ncbi:MAG TPA: ABC transporter permease, partial [Thermoanaerobaculia bacterium]|nr:ABC transporter permease [Thermoanaerobaculia bacterium]
MWLSQIFQVTLLNLRNLKERAASSLVAVIGIAGVVTIVVAVLSIAEGFRKTMNAAGAPDRAVVLRSGSASEMISFFSGDSVRLIRGGPGVAQGDLGPVASAELFVIIDLPKRTTGTTANVPLRGVEPAAFQVRPELKIVEGRKFNTGTRELVVGRSAQREFAGLDLGSVLKLGANDWTVVGVFDAGGSLTE